VTRRVIQSIVLCLACLAGGCAAVGPASIANGRMVYNDVINYTSDQQLLAAIVRERYGETFGMLSVASVTANIKLSSRVGAEAGIGPSSNFERNLVPLSAGVAYEENPTISYVPVQGEDVMQRLVTPLTMAEAFLLLEYANERRVASRELYRNINGVRFPLGRPLSPEARRIDEIGAELREEGLVRWGRLGTEDRPSYILVVEGYGLEHEPLIREWFDILGIEGREVEGDRVVIPIRMFGVRRARDAISIETRSALDLIRLAGLMVDAPDEHVELGIVEPTAWAGAPEERFITIRSSKRKPELAMVAVQFRGWWYWIDATDSRSKNSFKLIEFLVELRLEPTKDLMQQVPVLTVPVG
jgi:hypothetical protein